MKKYLTEFDELQAALRRVRIDEPVMSYYRGRLVENEDSYNKMQKLLDCPQMASSHRYLYDLDVENLQEGEIEKINALYDLGVKKGFIDDSFATELEDKTTDGCECYEPCADDDCECCTKPEPAVPVACWTVLYSAVKDGQTKTGECYSNAISVQAAKADCLAKLSRFGYENVQVLAIEAGEPGCCNENDLLRNRPHNAHVDANKAVDECGVQENDILKNRVHNAHVDADETVDESGKNPYAAGLKVVTGGKSETSKPATVKKVVKKIKEDDDESDEDAKDVEDEGADELDDSKKLQYKNEYRRVFQDVMTACKFSGKSFNDLTIDEKVEFFTELKKKWTKADPQEFMSDKEQDQLESLVVDADGESSKDEDSTEKSEEKPEGDEENAEGENTAEDSEGSEDDEADEADEANDVEDEGTETENAEDEGTEDEGTEDEGAETEDAEDEGTEDESAETEDAENSDEDSEDKGSEDTEA